MAVIDVGDAHANLHELWAHANLHELLAGYPLTNSSHLVNVGIIAPNVVEHEDH